MISLVLTFRGCVDPRAHGTVKCHGKNPGDTGIDPGTFRLVAQCLNHYATPGPGSGSRGIIKFLNIVWWSFHSQMFNYCVLYLRGLKEKPGI
jgi:hypothetical protein